jgi:hypothetical protein
VLIKRTAGNAETLGKLASALVPIPPLPRGRGLRRRGGLQLGAILNNADNQTAQLRALDARPACSPAASAPTVLSTLHSHPGPQAAGRARLGVKHDGYRLIVRRDGKVVRLFTRRGHDWIDRYPAIAAAAAKLRANSFTLDGEAVVSGVDGVAVFDALHRPGPRMRCCMRSISWSSTARICGRCRWSIARQSWRGCLQGRPSASCSARTPTRGRDRVPPCLQAWTRGHRVETAQRAVSVRTVTGLAQDEEPGQPSDAAGAGGDVVTPRIAGRHSHKTGG